MCRRADLPPDPKLLGPGQAGLAFLLVLRLEYRRPGHPGNGLPAIRLMKWPGTKGSPGQNQLRSLLTARDLRSRPLLPLPPSFPELSPVPRATPLLPAVS